MMTKKQLVEAVAEYPDDAVVTVAMGWEGDARLGREGFDLEALTGHVMVHSVSAHATVIVLEA